MTQEAEQTDVLIVGAGPAGLSLATELTMRGVRVQVIEQNDRVGVQPRAKTTNVRTMEHMRRWGLAERIRSLSPVDAAVPRRVRFATSLFGGDIKVFENSFCAERRRDERFSENAEWIPQYVIEKALLDHVSKQPLATVSFGRRLTGFVQRGRGVHAQTVDVGSGKAIEIRARYLVGADGARSTVRDLLGIAMTGNSSIASFVTLILKVPGLTKDPALRPALMHWLVDPDGPCIMGPMDRDDTWFWGPTPPPGETIDENSLPQRISHSLEGRFDFSVLAKDSWTAHKLLAERYRNGNVFLVGDACHLHSPFGGHGMNLGVGDSVDLGWKLAASLQGWAGLHLLDSYELERRQAHRRVLELGHRKHGFAERTILGAGAERRQRGRCSRARARRNGNRPAKDAGVPVARACPRLPLQRLADRGARGQRSAGAQRRRLPAQRLSRWARAALLVGGRALALRSVRSRVHLAGDFRS